MQAAYQRSQTPCSCSGRDVSVRQPRIPGRLWSRQQARRGWLGQRPQRGDSLAAQQRLRVQAAAENGAAAEDEAEAQPELSEEEIKKIQEEIYKQWKDGVGAHDPDLQTYDSQGGLSVEETIKELDMGSWRLRGDMARPFAALEAQVEGMWRELLGSDLTLYPLDKEFKWMDTGDPEGKGGVFGFRDLPDPKKGEPGWPRLQLENRAYASRVFRLLHMECVNRQDGLQVLHCVMYPRPEFDLPMLAMDMVGKDGRISLAVIDACPVSADRSLPSLYAMGVRELQQQYHMESNRTIPPWGRDIFSDFCVIMRPQSDEELVNFLKYAIGLSRLHLQIARNVTPLQKDKERRHAEITAAQRRFCQRQLENDKTKSVLAAGFGEDFAERYMREVMFDLA